MMFGLSRDSLARAANLSLEHTRMNTAARTQTLLDDIMFVLRLGMSCTTSQSYVLLATACTPGASCDLSKHNIIDDNK